MSNTSVIFLLASCYSYYARSLWMLNGPLKQQAVKNASFFNSGSTSIHFWLNSHFYKIGVIVTQHLPTFPFSFGVSWNSQ